MGEKGKPRGFGCKNAVKDDFKGKNQWKYLPKDVFKGKTHLTVKKYRVDEKPQLKPIIWAKWQTKWNFAGAYVLRWCRSTGAQCSDSISRTAGNFYTRGTSFVS